MERLIEILRELRRIAIVCNQWGDTGKGKLVELAIYIYLYELSRGVVWCFRGTGGPNAGHTNVVDGKKVILHEIPSGVMHDAHGCRSVIGPGVVVDPRITVVELNELAALGLSTDHLSISHEAQLILPQHIFLDRYDPKTKKIGTTGRGIGPAYDDFVGRRPIFVNDLLNPKELEAKIRAKNAQLLQLLGGSFDRDLAAEILANPYFGPENFFHPDTIIDVDKVIDACRRWAEPLRQYITDVSVLVRYIMEHDETVVAEGAQGLLLGIRHGTTRFQTPSDASAAGLILGCGFQPQDFDHVFGIAKTPYMTRVGGGPFPTEMGGPDSEKHCAKSFMTHTLELETFGSFERLYAQYKEGTPALSVPAEYYLGIGVRMKGDEFGATTGRPRRTGWLDLVPLKYAVQVNGPTLVLTKFDVMTGVDPIRLCTSYIYRGPEVNYAGRIIRDGDAITDFIRFSDIFYKCEPVYLDMPGWTKDISGCRSYDELPIECRNIVDEIEKRTGGKVVIISVAAERDAIIVR